jgi:hypothetical protein
MRVADLRESDCIAMGCGRRIQGAKHRDKAYRQLAEAPDALKYSAVVALEWRGGF